MLVTAIASQATGTNCLVVAPGRGEQCIVVDPGIGVVDGMNEVIAANGLHPVAVLLTHGHFDHTFSVLPVCQARDVPAYIRPDDRAQLTDPWSWVGLPPGTPLFGELSFAEPSDVRELADGARVPLAGLDFTVRHAPGHTAGSVVFTLDGQAGRALTGGADTAGVAAERFDAEAPMLFSGDVLFAGSIGRVDLPGGSMSQMLDSLRRVVLPLDDATTVFPGHGPSTSVGAERRGNPYLLDVGAS